MAVTAYAPASIGNVSLGFDLLGAALAPVDGQLLGDQVKVQASDNYQLVIEGRFAHKLPQDPDNNLVTLCYLHFNQCLLAKGIQPQTLALTLDKHLPIGSGLGSSASSVVASLHALNAYYDNVFTDNEMLLMMGQLEGQVSGSVHYDNVAPCFHGGLVLMTGDEQQITASLPVFEDWYWVVCYSGLSVSTSEARKILPQTLPLASGIDFGRQLAVFVHALYAKDEKLAASMMQDVIAEPYRKNLLPGFDAARAAAMDNGALAFGISGSGPTVFAVCNDAQQAEQINQWLSQHYVQNQDGFSHVCRLDLSGSTSEKV